MIPSNGSSTGGTDGIDCSMTVNLTSIADLHPAFCDRFTTIEDKHVLVMQILADSTHEWEAAAQSAAKKKLLNILVYIYRILGYRHAMAVPSALFLEKGLLTNVYSIIGFSHPGSKTARDELL